MTPAWVDEALAGFGEQLGLPGLALGATGVAQLELQSGGILGVEMGRGKSGDVIVYLSRPMGYDSDAALRKALERAHHSSGELLPVQVGIRGEGTSAMLVGLVRLPERQFTLDALTRAVEFLGRWSDGVRNG